MTFDAIDVIHCHAEGEVGDVIVGGIDPPPGATIWEQSRWIDRDQRLRNVVLQEPRGGVFRHVNLLVPPVAPEADAAFIIMEPMHTPPMSGSNSMCVATVLLDTGMIAMTEPITELTLEAPAGLVRVRAECRAGKAERVTITNVASFVGRLDAHLEVTGVGNVRVDTAYGGDTFVMVAAEDLGLSIRPENARRLAEVGMQVTSAATEQLGFDHPTNPEWSHLSFCQIHEEPREVDGRLVMRSTSVIEPGKLDRSPTGTGVSARLAVMHARGEIELGQPLVMRSVIDSEFIGRIEATTEVGGRPAVIPSVSGRAWITGRSTYTVHPDDPWPTGYRLSDTWPNA